MKVDKNSLYEMFAHVVENFGVLGSSMHSEIKWAA